MNFLPMKIGDVVHVRHFMGVEPLTEISVVVGTYHSASAELMLELRTKKGYLVRRSARSRDITPATDYEILQWRLTS